MVAFRVARQKKLILLWLLCAVPATALGGAVAAVVIYAVVRSNGFFSLPLPEDALLGGIYGAGWAVCIALPHWLVVSAWVKLVGSSERTRAALLVGMLVCALPQAVAATVATHTTVFLPAWLAVAFGLWLPRAVVPRLRPGAFAAERAVA